MAVLYHVKFEHCSYYDYYTGHCDYDDGRTLLLAQAIFLEAINSMILTFLYLTQTEEKTKMSGDPAITTLIIAATYTAVVGYGLAGYVISASPFNPAAAFGIALGQLFKGNIKGTEQIWVFFIFSYGGAMLAMLLFEYVYKKAMDNTQRVEDDEDGEDETYDALMDQPPVTSQ